MSRPAFRIRSAVAAALLGVVGVSALTLSLPAEAQAKKSLVLAMGAEPEDGFDPIKGWGEHGPLLFQSTLLKRDADLKLVTDLATDWSVSADRLRWTVKLRPGVKFSDGQPLTSKDVKFTYDTAKNAGGTLDLTFMDRVDTPDDQTVVFVLKTPRITFVQMMVSLGILPAHAYGANYAKAPLGSGPFQFVSMTPGQQVIMAPNPHYYGTRSPFERITWLFTGEDATFAAARSGQLDVAAVPPALGKEVPAGMKRLAAKTVDNRGLAFPMQPVTGRKTEKGAPIGNPVTSDPAIRQAINIAVDRKKLAEGALNGFATPAWGVADGLAWDNPAARLPDGDLAGAKALLAKAGWRDSDGDGVLEKSGVPARFTLLYPAGRQERQALALAVADMVRPLGIRIEPSGKSWDEIMPQAHSMPVVFGWGSHDPLEIAQLYHGSNAGKGFYNTGFYDNPVVNQHLDAAQKSASFEASIPHWKNAMWDGKTGFGMRGDAAWAWLVNLDHVYFVSNCLDIGPRQIEPHGHGLPIAWNLETWKWTCR